MKIKTHHARRNQLPITNFRFRMSFACFEIFGWILKNLFSWYVSRSKVRNMDKIFLIPSKRTSVTIYPLFFFASKLSRMSDCEKSKNILTNSYFWFSSRYRLTYMWAYLWLSLLIGNVYVTVIVFGNIIKYCTCYWLRYFFTETFLGIVIYPNFSLWCNSQCFFLCNSQWSSIYLHLSFFR